MISDERNDRLIENSQEPKSIVLFFRESPLVGVDLDLKRDSDTGRDIELWADSCSVQIAFPSLSPQA